MSPPRRCDAEALPDHRQQGAAPYVKAQDRRRGPASGETQHDMVMHLRTGAAIPDKERISHQIGPSDDRLPGERVPIRQHGYERFRPYAAGMAVGQLGRAGQEHDVQPVGTKLHHRIACRALGDLNLDAGMVFTVLRDQLRGPLIAGRSKRQSYESDANRHRRLAIRPVLRAFALH